MPIVTEQSDRGQPDPGWVVGVDTHTDTHAAAIVDHLGRIHGEIQVPADLAGNQRLTAWASDLVPAEVPVCWSVEGTRSHGHGLVRHLLAAGHIVVEAPKPVSGTRRRGGKSDALDAVHAVRAALSHAQLATPRADGPREALRMLLVTRRHHTDTRTATVNLFKSLILTATSLRETLRGLPTAAQVRTVLAIHASPDTDLEDSIRLQQLNLLARQITDLDNILAANYKQLRALASQICGALLVQPGVGPCAAATLLTAWSHRGRVRSEAAFASLAGVSPLITGSGRHHRHRLNRGGDRALNAALHTIVITRRRMNHPATSDYITRRTGEGRTPGDILRCLKRYSARQLFRIMQSCAMPFGTGFGTGRISCAHCRQGDAATSAAGEADWDWMHRYRCATNPTSRASSPAF